ncbi:hypothetical protein [Kitasatospora sp. NPDC058046]|uniref:hypothetical protein n=1 Tax=Kitasatospora sp. NPDC058046 TaxID=3346312 RepID=UPI0036D9F4BD
MSAQPAAEAPARVHDWVIPEREYARQEQRRGRRHAYTWLEPARAALVVVDMVPFFDRPYAPADRGAGEHPAPGWGPGGLGAAGPR